MQRRAFLATCAAVASPEAAWAGIGDAPARRYGRARLLDALDRPLKASQIPVRENLLFHYPFVGTPVFLINLGRPTRSGVELATSLGERYAWRGGVGPGRSIVAFSAICAHQLVYPTPEISFIAFRDAPGVASKRAEVIHCCADHSQYDPADGAKVLAGPAGQPLAAILLEHDPATDGLYAVGTQGGELFDAFFSKYQMRLSLEHRGRERQAVGDACRVQPMDRYCRQQVRC